MALVCSLVLSTFFKVEVIQSRSHLNWGVYHIRMGAVVAKKDSIMSSTCVAP